MSRAVRGNRNDPQGDASLLRMQPRAVMAGLVPAIHAAPLHVTFQNRGPCTAWMPGTGPGMTRWGCAERGKSAAWIFPGRSCAQRGRGTMRSVVEGARAGALPPGEGRRQSDEGLRQRSPPPPPSAVPLPRFAGEERAPPVSPLP